MGAWRSSRSRWAPRVGSGQGIFDAVGLSSSPLASGFPDLSVPTFDPIGIVGNAIGSLWDQPEEEPVITPVEPAGQTRPASPFAGILDTLGQSPLGGALTPLMPLQKILPMSMSDQDGTAAHTERWKAIQDGTEPAPPLANAFEGDLVSGWEQFGNQSLQALFEEIGLDAGSTAAACGPIAIAGALRAFGMNVDPAQIARRGMDDNLWSPVVGMLRGDGSAVAELMNSYGVKNQNIPANASAIAQVQALADAGVPVVLNFPKHYVLAQDYDPSTGKFFVGATASNALRGGADWMTLEELGAHPGNGGAVESFIIPQQAPASLVGSNAKSRYTMTTKEPQNVLPDITNRATVVESVYPLAAYYSQQYGIPPEVFLAFNIHEGGKTVMAAPFGIKGTYKGKGQMQDTFEVYDGQTRTYINDQFRAYDNLNEAYADFIDLVSNGRYKNAWNYLQESGDWKGWLRQVQNAGYATDPNWANSMIGFAEQTVRPLINQAGYPA